MPAGKHKARQGNNETSSAPGFAISVLALRLEKKRVVHPPNVSRIDLGDRGSDVVLQMMVIDHLLL